MEAKRIGRETPTKFVYLPYDSTVAQEAIDLYNKSSKRKLYPWQEDLLMPIMAQNEEGLWVHTKVGLSIPRRNGKTEIPVARMLYGLEHGEIGLYTAHRTSTSHSTFERLVTVLNECGYVDDEDFKSLKANGKERVTFVKTGGRVEFRTRTTTGGLGEGFDYQINDEAQEYTVEQESALKYTVSDSDNPQGIMMGTPPTPVSGGTVFTTFREKALAYALENAMWAEWSVDEESDVRDRALWWETNPSMGYHLNERKVADEIGDDDLDFNIQRLGLWIKYNQKSAISAQEWEGVQVSRMPKLTSKLYVGIKYGKDGKNVALSIAARTASGKVFVEAYDCQSVRTGNSWILRFLEKAKSVESVVIDGASGQDILLEQMKKNKLGTAILPNVGEVIVANALFESSLYEQSICHRGQPSLAQAVTNCEKRLIGSKGGFGYQSQFEEYEIALMDSIIYAHWACVEGKNKIKQRIEY